MLNLIFSRLFVRYFLHINDLSNTLDMLFFGLFAAATKTIKDLEAVMISELQKAINYCNLN